MRHVNGSNANKEARQVKGHKQSTKTKLECKFKKKKKKSKRYFCVRDALWCESAQNYEAFGKPVLSLQQG